MRSEKDGIGLLAKLESITMKNIDITLQLHKLFLQGFEKPYYLTFLCN